MTTLSEENYLKTIYHLGQQGTIAVSTNAIAEKIESKASSVTDMVKKLADKFGYTYIDVNTGLTDVNGNLKEEYTIEGVHMYANAYRCVLENLKQYL